MHPELVRRRGFALVSALALMALSGALLVGAVTVATALARSAGTERAALVVEASARHALATVLAEWGEGDALAEGRGLERELTRVELGRGSLSSLTGRVRIQRLTTQVYAIVVDVRAAAPTPARQRLRLLVASPPPADTLGRDSSAVVPAARGAPAPIVRWSAADLY